MRFRQRNVPGLVVSACLLSAIVSSRGLAEGPRRTLPLGGDALVSEWVGRSRFLIHDRADTEGERAGLLVEGILPDEPRLIGVGGRLSGDGLFLEAGTQRLSAADVAEVLRARGAPLEPMSPPMENPGPHDAVDGAGVVLFLGGPGPFTRALADELGKPVVFPRGQLESRTDVAAGALLGFWGDGWDVAYPEAPVPDAALPLDVVRQLESLERVARGKTASVRSGSGQIASVPIASLPPDTRTELPLRQTPTDWKEVIEPMLRLAVSHASAPLGEWLAGEAVQSKARQLGLSPAVTRLATAVARPVGRLAGHICRWALLSRPTR